MVSSPGTSFEAAIAACVAFTMVGKSQPLMMISCTLVTPSGRRDVTSSFPRRVGQYSALVLVMLYLYLLPAFEPLPATPPGKGSTTLGTALAADAALVAASSAASAVAPKNHKFPPMRPSAKPQRRSITNSPLRIGTTQHLRPKRSAVY